MAAARIDFELDQGATFRPTIRYASGTWVKKVITGITKSGRAVLTVVGHGIAEAWSGYIVGVLAPMDLVNHKSKDLNVPDKAYEARMLTVDTLELDLDTSRFGTYVSGGEFLYRAPVDLTSYTARMQLRESVDSDTIITTLTTENGGITLNADGTIDILIAATATDDFTFTRCWYDLELISGSIVDRFAEGLIELRKEVTR